MTDPRPNSRNARPAGVSLVTIPARWNSRHAQCAARDSSLRRASPIGDFSRFHHITRALSRASAARLSPSPGLASPSPD